MLGDLRCEKAIQLLHASCIELYIKMLCKLIKEDVVRASWNNTAEMDG